MILITILNIYFLEKLIKLLNGIDTDINAKIKFFMLFIYLIGLSVTDRPVMYTIIYNIMLHIAVVDEKEMIIPDKYIFILWSAGIIINLYNWNFKHIIISALIYICTIILVLIAEKITGGSLGGGDLKLLYCLNMLLGIKSMVIIFTFTCLTYLLCNIENDKNCTALGKYFLIGFMVNIIFF